MTSPGETVQLRDGTCVRVRPVEPDDAGALARAAERLSDESLYRRFFTPHWRPTTSVLDYLTRVDHHDHEALVALDPSDDEGVGVARYVRLAPGGATAEVAIVVADDWQGRGVGAALLARLADHARANGVSCFTATTLVNNHAVLELLDDVGELRVGRPSSGTVELSVDLRPGTGIGEDVREALRAAARGELAPPPPA